MHTFICTNTLIRMFLLLIRTSVVYVSGPQEEPVLQVAEQQEVRRPRPVRRGSGGSAREAADYGCVWYRMGLLLCYSSCAVDMHPACTTIIVFY